MTYGCIGEHLSHSFSKEIHNKIESYEYIIREVAREELDAFLTAREFTAINVTIPYKQSVIPYLHEISDIAGAIGAVNTIVNREVIFSMVERELGAYPALSADKIVLTHKGKKYQLTIYCAYLLSDQAGVPAFCDEFKPKLLSALEKGFGIADLEEIRLWICNPDENSTPADKEPGLVQEKDAYLGL